MTTCREDSRPSENAELTCGPFRLEALLFVWCAFVPVALALLLLAAAGLKAYALVTVSVGGETLWSSFWFLLGVMQFELGLGVWLLSGYWPRAARFAAIGAFSAFSLVALSRGLSGADSCGCFGRVAVNPWYTLGVDVVALVALLGWRPRAWSALGGPRFTRIATVVLLFLACAVSVGVVLSAPRPTEISIAGEEGARNVLLLEPERWVGQSFPLQEHIDIGDELMRGRWVVLLYRADCPECREELFRYGQAAEAMACNTGAPRVAIVEVPPYGVVNGFPISKGPWRAGKLREDKRWFVKTPAVVFLSNGAVRSAPEGEAWLSTPN
jgi:hypothetical protein